MAARSRKGGPREKDPRRHGRRRCGGARGGHKFPARTGCLRLRKGEGCTYGRVVHKKSWTALLPYRGGRCLTTRAAERRDRPPLSCRFVVGRDTTFRTRPTPRFAPGAQGQYQPGDEARAFPRKRHHWWFDAASPSSRQHRRQRVSQCLTTSETLARGDAKASDPSFGVRLDPLPILRSSVNGETKPLRSHVRRAFLVGDSCRSLTHIGQENTLHREHGCTRNMVLAAQKSG